MPKYKIGFIGAGQMGGALLRGVIEASLVLPENVWISDLDKDRLENMSEEFGVNAARSNEEAASNADVIILAVKPQQLAEVSSGLRSVISEDKLVVSIAAGVTTEKVSLALGGHRRVVRVMPNSPALIGKAMSVVSPGAGAGRGDVSVALELFGAVGEVVELPEEYQNRVTAISGSGPAYFYYLVEALIESAEDMGLSREVAEELVLQTMAGSAAMLAETGRTPAELRSMVTSPGGTTQAAISEMEKAGFLATVDKALTAAVRRAEELAQ